MKKLLIVLLLVSSSALFGQKPSVDQKNCPVLATDLYVGGWTNPYTSTRQIGVPGITRPVTIATPSPMIEGVHVKYKNTSTKVIDAVEVSTLGYDAFKAPKPLGIIQRREGLKPGKDTTLHIPVANMQNAYGGVTLTITRVLFDDGSLWQADKDHYCIAGKEAEKLEQQAKSTDSKPSK